MISSARHRHLVSVKHAPPPPTVFLRSRSLDIDAELQTFATTRAEALLSFYPIRHLDLALERGAGGFRCRARFSAARSRETVAVVRAASSRAALLSCLAEVRKRYDRTRRGRIARVLPSSTKPRLSLIPAGRPAECAEVTGAAMGMKVSGDDDDEQI